MSTDGGSVWSNALDAFYADGGAMAIDPNNSSVLYTGGHIYTGATYLMAVSKSTDGGLTWERDTLTTNYSLCYSLTVDRNNSNVVYAGGYNGYLFKTTNGGVTWFVSNAGISGNVNDIKISTTNSNIIYAGTSSGVFKSTNAGANWTSTGLSANVQSVLINPSNENEIYAASSNGIYKSTTGGGGWAPMNTGLWTTNTTSLGIYPNNWLFCGTNGSGIYRWNIQVGAEEIDKQKDLNYFSLQTSPNPFLNTLTIKFQTPLGAVSSPYPVLSMKIFDISGRLVKHFNHLSANQSDGIQLINQVVWDGLDDAGRPVPAGVYFVHLESENLINIEKVIKIE